MTAGFGLRLVDPTHRVCFHSIMDTVAVALADAPGFKGIWKAADPNLIVDTLRQFRGAASEMAREIGKFPSPMRFHAQTVSDTVIFAAAVSESTDENKLRMLDLLCISVATFTRAALLGRVPLAFRGCIALGDGMLEDGILVGEAVDTAATLYECSDVACVWLDHRARETVESRIDNAGHAYWMKYDVPIASRRGENGGGSYRRTLVANPLANTFAQAEHGKLVAQTKMAFDRGEHARDVDVLVKRQNTLDFLASCSAAAKEYWEKEMGRELVASLQGQ